MKLKMEEYEEYPVLPADSIVLLKLTECTVRPQKKRDGTEFNKLQFVFKILDIQVTGDGSPVEDYEALIGGKIYGSTGTSFNNGAQNKLKLWTEALLNMELDVGFELDTDVLVNRKCRGVTSTYDKRAINPSTGLAYLGHQVESLLPWNGDGTAPMARASQVASAGDPWASTASPSATQGFFDEPPF